MKLTACWRVWGIVVVAPITLCCSGPSEDELRQMIRDEFIKSMQREIVRPVQVVGPYSPAVRLGGFLFVSGQIGIDQETGALRNDSIEVETHQVLENLMSVLRSAGFDSSHVVSATVYLKNMEDYPKMNLIYGGYFPEDAYPARAAVEVSELPKGANVEISMIAYKPG